MAALTAIRNNEIIKTFYQRLLAAGKTKTLALTACMRKLLVILKCHGCVQLSLAFRYRPTNLLTCNTVATAPAQVARTFSSPAFSRAPVFSRWTA